MRPAFYDKFHCLMGACQMNCCREVWRITFDKKDYFRLRNLKGSDELNSRLKKSLRRIRKGEYAGKHYAEFNMDSGCCPMHRKDGLCLLQVEKGESVQPKVCHIFPREEKYTPFGYYEHSLSPACDGVLELLWNLPNGVDFICEPLTLEKQREPVFQTDLPFASCNLQKIRSFCIDILQDRQYPLPQRIFMMGIALKRLVDGETDIPHWQADIRKFSKLTVQEFLDNFNGTDHETMQSMSILNNLQVLYAIMKGSDEFHKLRKDIFSALNQPMVSFLETVASDSQITIYKTTASGEKVPLQHSLSVDLPLYLDIRAKYRERFGDKEYFMENLMVTLFFYLGLPAISTFEELWKSYVNFCGVYSFYQFMAVMSCRKGAAGDRAELFRIMVHTTRRVIHNSNRAECFQKELFQHNSATLAHMAVLLSI